MNNRWSVLGFTLGALAVLLILLLSGSWGGMMGPGWGYGMMGPWMMGGWGFGWIAMILAWMIPGLFLAALVIWAAQELTKKNYPTFKCIHCGTIAPANALFCPQCGQSQK